MRKSEYKRELSRTYAHDDVRHKHIYSMSRKHLRWCKKYLSRVYRRRKRDEADI